jgi:large subunit ribosomal protein L24
MKKLPQTKQRLHVKVGDQIKVIAGQEKGKIGTVKSLNARTSKVIIEGINLKTKHLKPKGEGESGQIQRLEFPIHSSNVSKYKE